MANKSGFIGAAILGAALGGLFHLIMSKSQSKVENPENQDDNKGGGNAVIEKPVDSIGDC